MVALEEEAKGISRESKREERGGRRRKRVHRQGGGGGNVDRRGEVLREVGC